MGELERIRTRTGRATALTRAALRGGTALVALAAAAPGFAQPVPAALADRAASLSPTALPTGGQVVAGQASITTAPGSATLNVRQSTGNAAVNWRSFDVGSQGTVNFTAPSPQSVTINRVTGPDPSVIAGKINANDQLVLVNQSGVLFTRGAEVNAQALVVSAPGITDANLKAGKLVFDQAPKANAAVVNQGHITVGQTGLAALVAPEVANSGVISAKFGHVVLAGAAADTVDLYGDGLLSIDVTRQVTTAPLGPDGKPVTALVTNSGTIAANGGTVLLTAHAVEGLVTNLVTASGKVSANTAVDARGVAHTGTIVVDAQGGAASVSGRLSAQGRKAGTTGGQIQVNATGAVNLAKGAVVNASGRAGGGTIALGTTLARAAGGPSVTGQPVARSVTIAAGATVKANATEAGDGGRVTVLSTDQTSMAGQISATGGVLGGSGGFVEVSGKTGYALTGGIDVGATGTILLDPDTLDIVATLVNPAATFTSNGAGGGSVTLPATGTADILPGTFNTLTGNVTLAAGSLLSVQTGISSATLASLLLSAPTVALGGNTVSLTGAGATLSVQANTLTASSGASLSAPILEIAPFTVSTVGMPITMSYGGTTATLHIPTALGLSAGSVLRLGSAAGTLSAGAVDIAAALSLGGATLDVQSLGTIGQTAAITAGTLTGAAAGAVTLTQANAISGLGPFVNSGAGGIAVTTTTDLTTSGLINAGSGALVLAVANDGTHNHNLILGPSGGSTTLEAGGSVDLSGVSGSITGATVSLSAGAAFTLPQDIATTGPVTVSLGTTNDFAAGGHTLSTGGHALSITANNISLTGSSGLAAAGAGVTLNATGQISEDTTAVITAGTLSGFSGGATSLGGANQIGATGGFNSGGALSLTDATALTVLGTLASVGTMSLALGANNLTLGDGVSSSGSLIAQDNIGITAANLAMGTSGDLIMSAHISPNHFHDLTTTLSGTFTESAGGIIEVEFLSGTATGGVSLAGTANSIIAVNNFANAGAGGMQITDPTLILAGVIDAGTGSFTSTSQSLQIGNTAGSSNTIRAGGTIALGSSFGPITSANASSVTLQAGGDVSLSAGLTTSGSVDINLGTTGVFSAGGHALNTGGNPLAITAKAIDLSASGSALNAGGAGVTLVSAGTIDEAGNGAITAGVLTGSASGAATLTGANSIGTIEAFTGSDLLSLTNAGGLVVLGRVSAANALTLALGANSLALDNGTTTGTLAAGGAMAITAANVTFGLAGDTISAPGQTLTVTQSGTLSDGGVGTLDVGTLTGTTTGGASLTSTVNAIGTLGPFANSGAGGIAVTTTTDLTTSGLVDAGTDALVLKVNNDGTHNHNLILGPAGGATTLEAGGSIDLTGVSGTITGATASLSTGADFVLPQDITTTGALTITLGSGKVFGSNGFTLNTGGHALSISAGTININGGGGGLTAAGAAVTLDATGQISEDTPNVITAGTLTGFSNGLTALGGANLIGATGGFSSGDTLLLTNATALKVLGTLASVGTMTLALGANTLTLGDGVSTSGSIMAQNSVSITAAGLSLGTAGDLLSARSTGVLYNLTTTLSGGFTEVSGATLDIAALSGTAVGGVSLPGTANAVSVLSNFSNTGAGGLLLATTAPLTVDGLINAGSGALTLKSSTVQFGVSINSADTLQAGTSIDLSAATGGLTGTSGNSVTLLAGGDVTLPSTLTTTGAVDIDLGTTGNFTAAGFAVNTNGNPLSVTAKNIDLSAAGSALSAAASSVSLVAAGTINEAGQGVITAGTLGGSAVGDATLTGANSIGTLDGFSGGGAVALTASGSLALAGPLSATTAGQTITLTVGTLTVTGTAVDTIFANAGTVQIAADALSLPASPVSGLISATAVEIAPRVAGAAMSFGTTGGLSVGTDGISAATLELGGFGGVAQAGSLSVGAGSVAGLLRLDSRGGITQSGSTTLGAGTLEVTAAGDVSLGSTANAIGVLGPVSDGLGNFSLTDGQALQVGGLVSAQAISLSTVGNFGISLATAAPAYGTLDGTVSVNLAAGGGSITETGASSIITPLLTGSLAGTGTISLLPTSATSNAIQALGSLSAASGTLTLLNGTGLTVSGPVLTAQTTLTNTAGGIAITGSLTGPTGVNLVSSGTGDISETVGGVITTGNLTGTLTGAGNAVSLTGTANAISLLGNFASPGSFSLADSVNLPGSLAVTGTVSGTSISLQDRSGGGTLTLTGTLSASGVIAVQADGMSLSGGSITTAGIVELAPTNGIVVTIGSTAANSLSLQQADLAKINAGTLWLGNTLGTTTATGISVLGTASLTALPLQLFAHGNLLIGSGGTAGSLTDTAAITLATSSVSETATSVLSTPTLTGSSFGVSLDSTLNTIGTLGAFTADTFALTDSQALTQVGSLGAISVALTDSSSSALALALNGSISASASMTLTAPSGGVTQATTSVLNTPTLFGQAGAVTLNAPGNTIGALGSFSTGTGAFTLTDASAMGQYGTLTGGVVTLTDTSASAPAISFIGTTNASTSLVLSAPNAGITEAHGAVLNTPTLTGSAASATLTATGNTVTTLGSFSTGSGAFSFTDASSLTQTGTLTGGVVTLTDSGSTGPAMNFTGVIHAGTSLALASPNAGVSEANGAVLNTPTLTGSAASATLTATGNTVATLGSFSAGSGAFSFTDASSLAQAGTLTGGVVTLTDSSSAGPAMNFGGVVNAGTSLVLASPNAGVSEAIGAVLNTPTLTGSAASATLAATGNTVATLDTFTTGTGAFSFTDASSLTQTGTLTGGVVTLTDSSSAGPALNFTGVINAGSSLALASPNAGITEAIGAVLNTPTLTGSAASATLTATGNTVTTLDTFSTGSGAFSFTDASSLTQAGTLTGGVVTLTDSSGAGPAMNFTGVTNAGTSLVLASPNAGVSEAGGAVLNTPTLTGSAASATLAATGNTVTTLDTFSTGTGAFSFTDASSLTQTGTLTGGVVTLTDSSSAGPALNFTGVINAGSSLALASPNAGVSEAGGAVLNTPALTGSAASATLAATGNTVATLDPFSAGSGAFSFTDASSLTQAGILTGGVVTLTDSSSAGPAMTFGGVVNAGSSLALVSPNAGVSEANGAILNTPTLTGSVASATLTATGNTVATLGSFSTGTAAFSFTDASSLTQTGTLTGGVVTLTDSSSAGPAMTFTGVINAGTSLVLASPSAGIAETIGAVLNTPTLTGSAASATLAATGNTVATLGSFSTGTGAFSFTDASSLTQAGTLTGGVVTLSDSSSAGPAMNFGGVVNAGSSLALVSPNAGVSEANGAILNTPTLTGSVASATLTATGNTVARLDTFSTGTGAFSFTDASSLTQTGTLTGGVVTLTDNSSAGPAMNFTGVTNAGTSLVLASPNAGVSEAIGAVLNTPTLTGSAASATLAATGNTVATLGSFSTGTAAFSFTDASPLTQTGTLTGGVVTLTDSSSAGPAMNFTGVINASTSLVLASPNAGVSETSGAVLNTPTLTGSAASATLTATGNTVATLDTFSTRSGAFSFTDASSLTQTGTLTGGVVTLTDSSSAGPAMSFTGVTNARTSLVLASPNAGVSEAGGAVLNTPTLTGSAASATLTATGNTVATLDTFSTGSGTFSFTDASSLTQAGTFTGGVVTLTDSSSAGPAMNFTGVTNASTSLVLASPNAGVSEAGGAVLNSPTLTGSAASATLTATGNTVATLDTFSTGSGAFSFTDASSLTQTGTLTGGVVTLTDSSSAGPAMNFTGVTNASTSLVLASPNAGVSETNGAVLNTPTLTGSAASATLTATGNTVATLDTFSTGSGAFSLIDASSLTQAGTLTGGVVTLTDSSGAGPAMNFTGVTNASTSLVLASANAGVSEAGGAVLNTPTLTGSAASATLIATGNTVTTLDTFSTGSGAFSFTDASSLTQTGTLMGGVVTLTDSSSAGPAMNFTGVTNASTSLVLASPNAGVSEAGGAVLNTPTLTGSAASATLTATGNTVTTLDTFSTGSGAFSFTDASSLTQAGTLTGGVVTLTDSSGAGPAMNFTGVINASTSLVLASPNAGVSEAGGAVLNTPTLTGSAASATLTATGNTVATLDTFSTGSGAFSFTDASSLTQTGTLTGGVVTLTDSSSAGPAMNFMGVTNASTSLVLASPNAGVSEAGGAVLNSPTLTGSAASATLTATGNTVATLDTFSTGSGAFSFTDASSLTQTGTLTGGVVTLTDSSSAGPAMNFTGVTNASTSLVLASPNAGVSEAGGAVLNTPTLTGSAASATLTATGNTVATLDTFSTGSGVFSFTDASSLTQTGTLTGGVVTLTDSSSAGPAMNFTGVTNATTSLVLASPNAGVSEAGGAVLNTPTLTGSASSATLTATGNTVATLDTFSTGSGAFSFTDASSLTQTGTLTGGVVTLSAVGGGGLTLEGVTSAGTALVLNVAAGGVQEAAGTIITPSLASTTGITGDAILTGSANRIASVGSLALVSGALQLVDASDLTVTGPVGLGGDGSIAVTGALTLAGPLNAAGQTLNLSASGALSQTGGIITAATLSAAASSITLGQGNLIGTYANLISSGSISLADAAALAISGTISGSSLSITTTGGASSVTLGSGGTISGVGDVTIAVGGGAGFTTSGTILAPGSLNVTVANASGGFVQAGGLIAAGTLNTPGGVSGDITLGSAANRIATLGSLAATGRIAVTDAVPMTVAGPVSASAIQLTDAGSITLSGPVTAGTLDLATGAGGVTQSGGTVSVATLSAAAGVVGGLRLTSAGNRIDSIGPMTVSGGDLVLTESGDLAVRGPLSAPDASLATRGSITLPGSLSIPGTLALAAGGTIVRPAGAGGFSVGTLTGSAMTLADFGTGSRINTLGSFILTGSTLSVDNAIPLSVTGPLQASFISITATDLLTLSGTITTTGLPVGTQLGSATPVSPGTSFTVTSSGTGATPTIHDAGLLSFVPEAGAATNTVRFQLPGNGGALIFDNLSGPQTALLLFTNSGGTATGQINAYQLYVVGSGGSTTLIGSIANYTGPEAARAAGIKPQPQTAYRLNACPIGSVNCVLIPLAALPPLNPLRDFVLDAGANDNGDDELLLPDVSSKDY